MSASSGANAKKEHWLHRRRLDQYERAMGRYALRTDALILNRLIDDGRGIALDMPCGTGRLTGLLRRKGYRVVLGDYGVSMLGIASKRTGVEGLRCDGFQLPFNDSVFDLVLCMRLLFHYKEAKKLLLELTRVVRPGGVILFDSLNRYSVRHAVEGMLNSVCTRAGRRIRFTSAGYWRRVAQELDCEVVRSETRYALPTRAYRVVPPFIHTLLRILDGLCPASLRVLRYWKFRKRSHASS